ncbi:MAG: PAS domain-containing protein [Candidatus Omnitrophica bacterium]|nr:PAS domain-containing protein [Candidatus Omnitrophota bacterium]
MILVKKRYLFILTVLFCLIVIFGEVKFFYALRHVDQTTDLDVKYEMENFIFASIVLMMIVFFFLVNFVRMSNNILKRLDKLIQLSSYGKYDVGEHLGKLGRLGERVNFLVFHLEKLNRKKSLKISSLSGMKDLLLEMSAEPLLVMDRYGRLVDCNSALLGEMDITREDILGYTCSGVLQGVAPEDLFSELQRRRKAIERGEITINAGGKSKKCRITFYPVINADSDISHAVGVLSCE